MHKLNIILNKIDDTNKGRYRNVAVRLRGSETILPNPLKVPELMEEFIKWLQSDNPDHTVKIAIDAHYKLVSIHPFVDGNGRTARLLMNLLLVQAGLPPAIIRKEDRSIHLEAIEPERADMAEPTLNNVFILLKRWQNYCKLTLKLLEDT